MSDDVVLTRLDDPRDGAAVIALEGELDLAVAPRLRGLVEAAVADRPSLLVLDVEGVAFMDSTILRELLRADQEVSAGGGRLVVAGAQAAVRRLLELTGTDEVLVLAENRAAALDS